MKVSVHRLGLLLGACVLLGIVCPAQEAKPQTMEFGGKTRSYRVHVPPGHDLSKPTPLVLVFHGAGGDGAQMMRLTGFNELADQHGFIVAYPEGYQKNWNDGRGVPHWPAQAENIDDVGYISMLIDRLSKTLNVDRRRVYATGISNGGLITLRIGCELSDKLAAIAPVARTLTEKMAQSCRPPRPLPVLFVIGDADPLIPWQGGEQNMGQGFMVRVLSAPQTVAHWVNRNGCAAKASVTELPDRDPQDGTRVRRELYGSCKAGAEVVLYAIEGGGHTWPKLERAGGPMVDAATARRFGKTSRDLIASEAIWEFFRKHALK
jgi:polyhydroxybutyrate depolymerase